MLVLRLSFPMIALWCFGRFGQVNGHVMYDEIRLYDLTLCLQSRQCLLRLLGDSFHGILNHSFYHLP